MPYLVPRDRTTRNLREKAEPAAERHPQSNPSGKLTKEVLVPSNWSTKNLMEDARALAFTMANLMEDARALAFTMAEILLSLTIIGVVAAITLPSLTGNINERTWNTQRKALYARFSQAIALMPALNGYGTLTEDESGSVTEDTAAETFVTAGLSKVLKINNICDNDHLYDCGFSSSITTLKAEKISLPKSFGDLNPEMLTGISAFSYSMTDVKAAAFETANGESVLTFYNPNCKMDFNGTMDGSGGTYWFAQPNVCVNFVYDLNGSKGPNTVGKDIGVIGAIYPSDTVVVAPYPNLQYASSASIDHYNALKVCTKQDLEYRLPNVEEAIAMFVNKNLFELSMGDEAFWTSTITSSEYAIAMASRSGRKIRYSRSLVSPGVICVKR